jgi:hypothetical protein
MCVRVNCPSCGKATYAGCGAHIEQVLRGVPAEGRCKCREPMSADEAKAQSAKDSGR